MKILDGDQAGMIVACEMIAANPHPDHLSEFWKATGKQPDIEDMLVDSVRNAEITAYSIRGGDAMVGGISGSGLLHREIWFLTTAGAGKRRVWLLREARRMLRLAEDWFGPLTIFGQIIPLDYPEGINFARHLGFARRAEWTGPNGHAHAIMERCGLWARKR